MSPLWTVIRLSFDNLKSSKNLVELARERLERAGQFPISIFITSHISNTSAKEEDRVGQVHIDWTQLTDVYIYEPSTDDAIELLRRAPNLVHCKYDTMIISRDSNEFTPPAEPIILRNLKSVNLMYSDRDDTNWQEWEVILLLKSFIFSNLKELVVDSGKWYNMDGNLSSWTPVFSNIINSSPPLTSLCIRHFLGPGMMTGGLLPILRTTPSLRELEMIYPWEEGWGDHQNNFLQLLADTSLPNSTQAAFLPNLKSLTFHPTYRESNRIWEAIPWIFGPISDIHNPHRRPLKKLCVRVNLLGLDDYSQIISIRLVRKLWRLRNEEIVLDLTATEHCGDDVLGISLRLHSLVPTSLEEMED